MHLRLLTLAAVTALICADSAQPVTAAAPLLWTVTYAGSGTYTQNGSFSMAPLCSTPVTSTYSSSFSWSVAWHSVVVGPAPNAGSPSGRLTGTEHTQRNDPGANCSTPSSCTKDVPFSADEGPSANQPATLKIAVTGAIAEINIDLRESATGNGVVCKSAGTSGENYLLVGTKGMPDPQVRGALAAYAKIPVAELRSAKKIIVPVSKNAFTNYPVTPECAPNPIQGLTCTHSQSWTGTVTLQRP
jgi:hypothetical protein